MRNLYLFLSWNLHCSCYAKSTRAWLNLGVRRLFEGRGRKEGLFGSQEGTLACDCPHLAHITEPDLPSKWRWADDDSVFRFGWTYKEIVFFYINVFEAVSSPQRRGNIFSGSPFPFYLYIFNVGFCKKSEFWASFTDALGCQLTRPEQAWAILYDELGRRLKKSSS